MHKFLSVAAVGLFSVGLVACGSNDSGAEKVESNNNQEKTQQEEQSNNSDNGKEEKEEQTEFAVGDSIKKDGKVVTIENVERTMGGEMDSPDQGNEYLVANVAIENKGDENISYNPFNYQIKNGQGQITDTAITIFNQDKTLDSGELASGGNVSGQLTFEVPKDSSNSDLTILIKNNMFSNENIKVNLG